jgi:hypothetical protein
MSDPVIPNVASETIPAQPDVLGALTPTQRDHWRLTGELPESKVDPAPVAGEPLQAESDLPATPEPVEPSTEPEKLGKPRSDMRARLGQEVERTKAATARAEAAERRAAELEARLQPAPQTAAPVAPTGEPTLDQFLDQPDPYAALSKATALWAVAQFQQQQIAEQGARAITARRQAINEAGEAKYADWGESLTAPDVTNIPLPPYVMQLLHESDLSVDVLYHLSKHPAEVRALAAMEPLAAAKTIGSLETRLSGDTSRPAAKTTSDAPRPPTTLGTKPAVPGDDVEAAVKAGDFSRYRELANAREMAGAKR